MSNVLQGSIKAINVGVESFAKGLRDQGVTTYQINWRPPIDAKLIRKMNEFASSGLEEKIEAANKQAFNSIISSEPEFVGIKRVIDVVPGMKENMVLHSGPPVDWDNMHPAQKNGCAGAVMHEGLAKSREDAFSMIERGEIIIESATDHYVVGAGMGIVSAHMVVNISRDRKTGLEGYCIPFEGRTGLGVWGVYNDEVEETLKFIENDFAPLVTDALEANGPINVRNIIAKSLQMSDELHTRQTAGGLMLVSELVPKLLKSSDNKELVLKCIEQITATERWFHPVALSAAMAMSRAARDIPYSTVVTASVQNGVETGIKISGLGEQWFTAPAPKLVGSYFSSEWGPDDAAPYFGDSTVSEVVGLGAFSAAASPVVMRLRDGGYREALAQSEEMRQITVGNNANFAIPLLDFTGPGTAVDIRKIIRSGITPICHGGIISKNGGQIGAGAARFPSAQYVKALNAFIEKYSN